MDARNQTNPNDLALRQAAAEGNLDYLITIFGISNKESKWPTPKANINGSGPSGKTALHQAVMNNRNNIVAYLVQIPGIKHSPDKDGKTPWDYAQKNVSLSIKRTLCRNFEIESSPQIPYSDLAYKLGTEYFMDVRDKLPHMSAKDILAISKTKWPGGSFYQGYTCLAFVVLMTSNWDAIRLLIRNGNDHNAQVASFQPLGYCNTPLHMLVANESINDTLEYIKIIREEKKQIDWSIRDDEGKTTLLLAAKIRRADLLKVFLEQPIKPEVLSIPDNDNSNILHYACLYGDIETFNLIKKYDENIFKKMLEQKNNEGKSPADMLEASKEKTRFILDSIWINPDRDLNAPSNAAAKGAFKSANKSFVDACFEGRAAISEELLLLKTNQLKLS